MLASAARFCAWKLELVLGHIHATSAKNDAFGFQAQPLFDGRISTQLDFPAGAEDTMPGQPPRGMQRPDYLARRAGIARGACDGAVGGYFPPRDFSDSGKDAFTHWTLFSLNPSEL